MSQRPRAYRHRPPTPAAVDAAMTRRETLRLACLGAGSLLLPGCALSYRRSPESSDIITVYAPGVAGRSYAFRSLVRSFRDQVIDLTEEFGVPLLEVIPVRVFVDGEGPSSKSYFNPLTGSIVLRGTPEIQG